MQLVYKAKLTSVQPERITHATRYTVVYVAVTGKQSLKVPTI